MTNAYNILDAAPLTAVNPQFSGIMSTPGATGNAIVLGGNANSAPVNGVTYYARETTWIDDAETTTVNLGLGRAENTVAGLGTVIYGGRARGTQGAPAIVQSGDQLLGLYSVGYNGAGGYSVGALVSFDSDGAPGATAMPGRIRFSTSPAGSQSPSEAARITSAQNLLVGKTSDAASARVQSSNGIDVGNSANASAVALDWYEEGTITPTITSSGGGTPVYSSQVGIFTRMGNIVMFSIRVALGGLGTLAAGNVSIAGLPYASRNLTGLQNAIPVLAVNMQATALQVIGRIGANGVVVGMFNYSGGSAVTLTVADLTASSSIVVTGQYTV